MDGGELQRGGQLAQYPSLLINDDVFKNTLFMIDIHLHEKGVG